jgi:hypothetical protein
VQPAAHCNQAQSSTADTKYYLQRYETKKNHPWRANVQDYTNIQDVISYLQGTTFLPRKNNTHASNKKWKVRLVAGVNSRECQQTLQKQNCHSKRTHVTNPAKHEINTTKANTRGRLCPNRHLATMIE